MNFPYLISYKILFTCRSFKPKFFVETNVGKKLIILCEGGGRGKYSSNGTGFSPRRGTRFFYIHNIKNVGNNTNEDGKTTKRPRAKRPMAKKPPAKRPPVKRPPYY